MQSVGFRSVYEPVGGGHKALVVARWLFALITRHVLKGADSIMVPITSNNLAIGSTNGGANDFFHRGKIYHAKGPDGSGESTSPKKFMRRRCLGRWPPVWRHPIEESHRSAAVWGDAVRRTLQSTPWCHLVMGWRLIIIAVIVRHWVKSYSYMLCGNLSAARRKFEKRSS
jgi:hypothetical protein